MTTDDPKWEPWMEKAVADEKESAINWWITKGKSRVEAEAWWIREEPDFRERMMAGYYFPGREKYTDKPPYVPYRGTPAEPQEPAATEPSQNVSLNQMLSGMHQLTHDDLIDMWQKAQTLPEPQRQKAIRYITHLSTQLESKPARLIADLLLEII